jgi:hypothetical protein
MSQQPRWNYHPQYVNTATLPRHLSLVHADAEVDATAGYNGGAALTGSSEDAYVAQHVAQIGAFSSPELFGAGSRCKVDSAVGAEKILLAALAADFSIRVCVAINAAAQLLLYRGELAELLGPPSATIAALYGSHFRLGLRARLSTSGAYLEVHVNGAAVAEATAGADLSGANWAAVAYGLGPTIYHGHLYAGDLATLLPAYLCDSTLCDDGALDDATPDDDTTTQDIENAGDEMSAGLASPTSRVRCYGAQVLAVSKGSATLTRQALHLTVNGASHIGQAQGLTEGVYAPVYSPFHITNPATGLPFADLGDVELSAEALA